MQNIKQFLEKENIQLSEGQLEELYEMATEDIFTSPVFATSDEERLDGFVDELTRLSKKYNITMETTGGLYTIPEEKINSADLENLEYYSGNSGDLIINKI